MQQELLRFPTERYPTLAAALDEWLGDLRTAKRASTATTYAHLLAPLRALDLHTHQLSPVECRRLASDAVTRGLSANSIRTIVYALRSFCGWCVDQGYMTTNPALPVAKPRKELPPHQWLLAPQLRAMMRGARDDYDRLAMLLLAGAGLRAAEFCGLKWSHVDHGRGVLTIYGKGGKWREIAPGSEAMRLLSALQARHPRKPVIPWGTDSLRDRIARMGKAAGRRVHPHMLRHTFAIQYLKASDGDAFSLQQLLGHASPDQTAWYTRSFRQDSATSRQQALNLTDRLFGGAD